jgi:hypothetical protein
MVAASVVKLLASPIVKATEIEVKSTVTFEASLIGILAVNDDTASEPAFEASDIDTVADTEEASDAALEASVTGKLICDKESTLKLLVSAAGIAADEEIASLPALLWSENGIAAVRLEIVSLVTLLASETLICVTAVGIREN